MTRFFRTVLTALSVLLGGGCGSPPSMIEQVSQSLDCAGKVNGWYCGDGGVLFFCKNKTVNETKPCPSGCQVNLDGTNDECKPLPVGYPFEEAGWRETKDSPAHKGKDLCAQDWNRGSGNDDCGKNVLAQCTGTVVSASSKKGYGNDVVIACDGGVIWIRSSHLQAFSVKANDRVCLGEVIGQVGRTGGNFTCHLHNAVYSAWPNPKKENALRFVFDATLPRGCVSSCTSECSSVGAKHCSGNTPQECRTNAQGCLYWANLSACSTNQSCSNGTCVSSCTSECSSVGAKRCGGNTPQECRTNAQGCRSWVNLSACSTNQSCSNGTCISSCSATSHWIPTSLSSTASGGLQYNANGMTTLNVGIRLEIAASSILQIRACRTDGASLANDLHVQFQEWDKHNGLMLFHGTLAKSGACTQYGTMNHYTSFSSGDKLGGSWQVVSPGTSAQTWAWNCSKPGSTNPTGTCWKNSTQSTERTCR